MLMQSNWLVFGVDGDNERLTGSHGCLIIMLWRRALLDAGRYINLSTWRQPGADVLFTAVLTDVAIVLISVST